MGISNVIALLSGVALFLFGMTLMGDGLKKVAGNKLELVLYKLSGNPIKGVLLGTGVTAIIQSSSATSVMVVGFVNSGMMKVKQAIGIIMGAILGTSVTGWIICLSALEGGSGWVSLLSTATLTGVVAVIGIILRMFCKKQSKVHIGDILMGFAVLMFGMQAMSSSVAPLQESEAFLHMLTTFSNPILGILVGLIFTCVLQSASAAVGILQALAATGAVTFEIALPIIMGIAIGAGFYECVVIAFVLMFLCIHFLPVLEVCLLENARNMNIYVELKSLDEIGVLLGAVKTQNIQIYGVEIDRGGEEHHRYPSAVLSVRLEHHQQHPQVLAALSEITGVIMIEEI